MIPTPGANFRFGASSRIQRSGDFARLRVEGRRLAIGCLAGNWQVLQPGSASRVGVVSSKRLGCAVVRNRARRLLREAFRLNQYRLAAPVKIVLVARNSIVGKVLPEVEQDYLALLKKAGLLKQSGGAE